MSTPTIMPPPENKIITAEPETMSIEQVQVQFRDEVVGAINVAARCGLSRYACAAALSTIWFQIQYENLEASRQAKGSPDANGS